MDPAAHLQTQLIPLRSALIVDAVSQVSAALCGVLSREEWNIVHASDNRSALRLVEARSSISSLLEQDLPAKKISIF